LHKYGIEEMIFALAGKIYVNENNEKMTPNQIEKNISMKFERSQRPLDLFSVF
jgi:hypothetical protein